MKAYGGLEMQHHSFLASALDGGGLFHASAALSASKESSSLVEWLGLRAGLDAGEEKYVLPVPGIGRWRVWNANAVEVVKYKLRACASGSLFEL
jgi:hypothetical protein